MACTIAVGDFVPPMVIYKGKMFQHGFQEAFINGSLVKMTESGWMNDVFLQLFEHLELHRVKGPCLLLLDGHSYHKFLKVLEFCSDHDITVLVLPSYRTHRLQPLDGSFFKPLKSYLDSTCNSYIREQVSSESKINKFNFGKLFEEA